ncbi:MAG: Omp28-related outer membrane protein [bacterium]
MKKITFIFAITLIFMISFFNNSYSIPRNGLIEYVTGTWCGNCPCGHQTLNTINSQYPQTIVLAYHAFSNDPWRNFNGNQIVSLLNFSATPSVVIDREFSVSNLNYPLWISSVQNSYAAKPDTKINLVVGSKSYNESTRELSLTVNATPLEALTGQYKINFVIVENNLIYPQNVYSQCGTAGVIQNYVHNHVVRNMINNAEGENLNSGNTWNTNQLISKNIVTVVNTGWNEANSKVVVFVYKDNAPLASANVEQAIEESVTGTVGISGNETGIADNYSLSQNFPNPFNPATSIKFSLPGDGNVSFKIFDISGKEVSNYVDGFLRKGSYNVEFDGTGFSSGVYFYVLKTDNFVDKKKMILIK